MFSFLATYPQKKNYTKIGVSKGPHHSTNPPDPPETERPSPEPTNPMVGGGSPPTEPEPFGSVGGFPPQKLEPPDSTITSTTSSDIQRFSNKKWQIPAIFLLFRRRYTWNLPNPATFKGFPTKNTNTGDIFAFLTKIYLKSTKSCEIRRYFVEI